jgi:hypothetical protein
MVLSAVKKGLLPKVEGVTEDSHKVDKTVIQEPIPPLNGNENTQRHKNGYCTTQENW